MLLFKCLSGTNGSTWLLLGLCLLSFALIVVANGSLALGFFGPRASRDAVLGGGGLTGLLVQFQPWRLLSANFAHFSLIHLMINLYALHSVGRAIEKRFGGARVIATFCITGVVGFLLSSYLFAWSGPVTAGASGATFGLMGAEVSALASERNRALKGVLVQNLFLAFVLAAIVPANNFVHLGGGLAGIFCGIWLQRDQGLQGASPWAGKLAFSLILASAASILLSYGAHFSSIR